MPQKYFAEPVTHRYPDVTPFLLAGDDRDDRPQVKQQHRLTGGLLTDLPETEFRPVYRWQLAKITSGRR